MTDPVNHPAHYTFSEYEPDTVLEAWELNPRRREAVRYILRAGKKDPAKEIEDLEKARQFLAMEIASMRATGMVTRCARVKGAWAEEPEPPAVNVPSVRLLPVEPQEAVLTTAAAPDPADFRWENPPEAEQPEPEKQPQAKPKPKITVLPPDPKIQKNGSTKEERCAHAIVDAVKAKKRANQKQLADWFDINKASFSPSQAKLSPWRRGLELALADGRIKSSSGPNNSIMYTPA